MVTYLLSSRRLAGAFCACVLPMLLAWAPAAPGAEPPPAAKAEAGAATEPSAPAAGDWVNVTNNVGGDTWGYGGVTLVACVPDADEVIAGVSEKGLWSSTDGGKTWTPMAADSKVKITHRPYAIVFDPKDPRTFWETGNYGPGIFKTTDGGKTFERLATLANVDGLSVDFSDPDRKTILVGLHEQIQSVTKSADGGKMWRPIGKNLPPKSNHSNSPLVLDAKVYLVNSAGWLQGHTHGIFRTEDGGQTWTQVSDLGPTGRPLLASDGAIYWSQIWERGLLKSTDQGKTWTKLEGVVKRTPIELAGGRLVAPAGAQLHLSTDGAKSWKPVGPPAPFSPNVVAYSDKRNCFYVSRSMEKKADLAIARFDLPDRLEVCLPKKRIVWDGETAATGKAWTNPEGTTCKAQSEQAHSAPAALEFHPVGKNWAGGGWNWHAWWPKDAGTNITGFKNLVFWVKVAGEKPDKAGLAVGLASSTPGAKPTGQVPVLRYCPTVFDGNWHEVVIPLADLYGQKTEFDAKKAWEFNIGVTGGGEFKFNLYFDDIAFDDRPVGPPAPKVP